MPDTSAMGLACANNHYTMHRIVNSTTQPVTAGAGPLNAGMVSLLTPLMDACKALGGSTPAPCVLGGTINFGMQTVTMCEAAQVVAISEIMSNSSLSTMQPLVQFCPAHGANFGGCEADGKTPTALAYANAQAAIMASSCAAGASIMSALSATAKSFMDKDGDNILDACSTTTTTTTTAAKKKDSSAAGLTVSLTALASAALATIF